MDVAAKRINSENALAWLAGIFLASLGLLIFHTSPYHLFLPGTRVDLGEIRIGQTGEGTISLFNHWSKPIVIVDWSPTCHCIQAQFPQTSIPSGKSMIASIRTSAVTPLGKRAAVISIRWHFQGESLTRTDNLVVSARYVSPLLLSVDRLDFSLVLWSETSTKSLFVRDGNMVASWNGLDVTPASDRLSVRVRPSPTGFNISTDFNPRGLPSGVWKSAIKLFTLKNSTRTGEEIDVPIVARIEGPFTACPSVVQFSGKPGRPASFTLKIHSSTVPIRKLSFLSHDIEKPIVEITSDGKDAIVTGSLLKPPTKDLFVGKIPLQINDGPEGFLAVPFIGYPG
jgi:hypothetical protein